MTKHFLFSVASWAVAVLILPSLARAKALSPQRDLGREVREVFAARCAVCHGPDLERPRGRFGYVLDLKRIAENPEMVIPGEPDQSELWVLVSRGEMPQADSPRGPLTPAQKDLVREWIAAGAPAPLAEAAEASAAQSAETTATSAAGDSLVRLLRWLGKFHLVLLHLPIALVLAAGVAEAGAIWRQERRPSEIVRFCLWVAALGAVPTAALGWLFAATGGGLGAPQILTTHRWLGTTTAAWLVILAVCAESDARRGLRSGRVRLLLAAGILLVAVTAHFGGLLARGADFFTF